jgi:hypothetical protein
LARLCAALQHNANIDPYLALDALRRGERVPVVEERQREGLPGHSGPGPEAQTDAGWDEVGDEEDEGDGDGQSPFASPSSAGRPSSGLEPSTRDGNRVRKIHSLDSFMDEVQRLTQCVQEGDFQRLVGEDDAAAIKVRLAARQLRFLSDAVSALAEAAESA